LRIATSVRAFAALQPVSDSIVIPSTNQFVKRANNFKGVSVEACNKGTFVMFNRRSDL